MGAAWRKVSGQTQQGINLALGTRLGGVGEGSEGKGASPPRPPFFRNFSCAHHFVPLSTIWTPGTGYFDLKLQMVQFREWCIRPITSSFFRLQPNCRTEMPVRFVNLALVVSMFYLIEITTLFLLENSGSTVCKFHRFKRKLAITLGYFHPGWCVCVTQVISFRKSWIRN